MLTFIRQAWLVLLLALMFGVALAGVNTALKPRIEENARLARQRAAVEVFASEGAGDGATAELIDIDGVPAYRVKSADGDVLGLAYPAQGQGYADTIKLVFGVDADRDKLTGVKVIYNQETPGLGNKIVDPPFTGQFVGKPACDSLRASTKTADLAPNEIMAITGATISSDAVCTIINTKRTSVGLIDKPE